MIEDEIIFQWRIEWVVLYVEWNIHLNPLHEGVFE